MDLSDDYAVAVYIPDADTFPPRWAAAAAAFRLAMGQRAELDIAYGESSRQVFDLFAPQGRAKGVVIFVHGGYWRAFDKSSWSHLAKGALTHGWAVAMPSYDLCPDVRISDITRQIARAVNLIAERVPGPVKLVGHSAGGHLVSRMLDTTILPGAVSERIDAVVPISPVSDLRPLLHTSMNADFQLDERAALAECPILMPKPQRAKVAIHVGALERPVFLQQAQMLADAWQANLTIVEEQHHFDVIDALADAGSAMVSDLIG